MEASHSASCADLHSLSRKYMSSLGPFPAIKVSDGKTELGLIRFTLHFRDVKIGNGDADEHRAQPGDSRTTDRTAGLGEVETGRET